MRHLHSVLLQESDRKVLQDLICRLDMLNKVIDFLIMKCNEIQMNTLVTKPSLDFPYTEEEKLGTIKRLTKFLQKMSTLPVKSKASVDGHS